MDDLQKMFPVGTMSLDEFCSEHKKVGLAFSGGCDSSYLLSVLLDKGVVVKPYMVKTAFQFDFELDDAHAVAKELGVSLEVIEADILCQEQICLNSSKRCYYCKRFIFGSIKKRMLESGYSVLVDGTNASDMPKRRPGFWALLELGVLSPLRLADLTKADIRQASRARGLFTAEKPSFSCLATKIPAQTPITQKCLDEAALILAAGQSHGESRNKDEFTKGNINYGKI
jgi:pyridinium-3,5-biscarboxylic acid mononucleotide sulfurtransferase